MILILQVAAGVFIANLAAAAMSVTLQRISAKKRKRMAEDTLKMIEALDKASKDATKEGKQSGSYL